MVYQLYQPEGQSLRVRANRKRDDRRPSARRRAVRIDAVRAHAKLQRRLAAMLRPIPRVGKRSRQQPPLKPVVHQALDHLHDGVLEQRRDHLGARGQPVQHVDPPARPIKVNKTLI
jgi:hypothetical protein